MLIEWPVKDGGVRGGCGTNEGEWANLMERDHLENVGVDGKKY